MDLVLPQGAATADPPRLFQARGAIINRRCRPRPKVVRRPMPLSPPGVERKRPGRIAFRVVDRRTTTDRPTDRWATVRSSN